MTDKFSVLVFKADGKPPSHTQPLEREEADAQVLALLPGTDMAAYVVGEPLSLDKGWVRIVALTPGAEPDA
jgi:hypothetical protein